MEIVYGLGKPLKQNDWPVVTVGVFDGVHRGHSEVIRKTVSLAKEMKGKSIVITFCQSPKVVFGKMPSSIITSLEHRLNIFRKLGVDITVVLEFNNEIANIKAEDFIKDVLHDWLHAKGIVLGCNCSFGKDRKGNREMIMDLAEEYGYEAQSCEPIIFNGERISSTLIRETILKGNLEHAEAMLGRPVIVFGTVVSGSGRGSQVLFATANLDLHHEVLPPLGVYGTFVQFKGKEYNAITNIGTRPTFEKEPFKNDIELETVVEVHILNFNESIYGQDLEVQFVLKIRDEKKFDSVDELKKQIENDRETFLRHVEKLKANSN